jgi:hypothetical protein
MNMADARIELPQATLDLLILKTIAAVGALSSPIQTVFDECF